MADEKEHRVCVNFFDDSNQSPIDVEGTELQIRAVGTKDWTAVSIESKREKVQEAKARVKAAKAKLDEANAKKEHVEETKAKVEEAEAKLDEATSQAGSQYFAIPGAFLSANRGHEPLIVDVRLAGEAAVGCTRYATSIVSFLVKEESSAECCCIPFPLHKLAETCSIKFCAFDASEQDYIKNAKTFQSSVEWTVTAVRAPVISHTSAAQSHTPAHSSPPTPAPSTPKFQPFTSSVRSVDGYGEIFDVPPHALYQIEARGPDGYFSEGPALQYRYICCERSIEVKNYFKPCGKRPTRSVVFVQQKCQGVRWGKGTTVLVGGREVEIGKNGIMNVPDDLNGVFPISFPGKAFTPSTLDLREGTPPVSTIAVSDQPVTTTGRTAEGVLLDSANKPFVGRRVAVLLPNGDEVEVTTDSQGRFQAPYGSTVYAREDEWGMATERVLLTESI